MNYIDTCFNYIILSSVEGKARSGCFVYRGWTVCGCECYKHVCRRQEVPSYRSQVTAREGTTTTDCTVPTTLLEFLGRAREGTTSTDCTVASTLPE